MQTIDWLSPEIGVVAEYFQYVWIRTLEFDLKQGWLEASVADSECENLQPSIDFREHAYDRSVSGYCVFGVSGSNKTTLAPGWENYALQDTILWGPSYFLNWKETLITPPRGFNAIRLWGRARSHFYMYAQTYSLDDMLNAGVVRDPATGQPVYPAPPP